LTNFFGKVVCFVGRKCSQSFAEKCQHQVVTTHGKLEFMSDCGDAVVLARTAGATALCVFGGYFDVATSSELFEMVSGHIRMKVESVRNL
jgi:hypothetical protein